MKSKKVTHRKSKCDPARGCYLSKDGKFYCYSFWDPDLQSVVEEKLEVGKDLSIEMTLLLDELDHDADLNDRYQEEACDPLFRRKTEDYEGDTESEDTINPWEEIPDNRMNPELVLFSGEKQEDPAVLEVRRIIEEECTEEQQNLFYAHFGEGRSLKELRLEEEAAGEGPSQQAFTNRKNRIIRKIAKSLEEKSFEKNSGSNKG